MAQIGNLVPMGTAVINLDYLPETINIDEPSGSYFINNLSVVTSGNQLVSITANNRIGALAEFDSGAIISGSSYNGPARRIKLALGRVNKATTLSLTEFDGTNSPVLASSTNMSNVVRLAVEQSINPSTNGTFSDFEALFYDPSNVLRVQLTFENGFTDEFTPLEIDRLYAGSHISGTNGRLSGLSCIDSENGNYPKIIQAVIYVGSASTSPTVVLKTGFGVL